MNIWKLLSINFYICWKVIYYCFKLVWICSYICSLQGLFFLCVSVSLYNYFINIIDSYLHPIYDYLEISDILPSRKDMILYPLCSVVQCEHPSIQISQMVFGWKPINQTFIFEFINIDLQKITHIFGVALGEGIVSEIKSSIQTYIQSYIQKIQSTIHYLDNK